MKKLTSDYGVIIKWSDYFIESFEYNTKLLSFIDDTYIGDNDIWHMPVYCLQGKDKREISNDNHEYNIEEGTWIHKGDKIGQFRIMEVMPEIEFEEVESFGNADRGGFGTTGQK